MQRHPLQAACAGKALSAVMDPGRAEIPATQDLIHVSQEVQFFLSCSLLPLS